MHAVLPAALVLLALAVGGCLSDAGEGDAEGIWLEDLRECRLQWSDGSTALCETTVPRLDVQDGRPTWPWVCVREHGFNGADIALYHDAIGDRFAVWVDASEIDGAPMAYMHDGGRPLEVWWPPAGTDAYVVVPEDRASLTDPAYRITFTTLEAEPTWLEAAVLHVDMLTQGDEAAPLVAATVGPETYYFSPLGPAHSGHFRFEAFGVGTATHFFVGEDFQVELQMDHSEEITFVVPLNPTCVT